MKRGMQVGLALLVAAAAGVAAFAVAKDAKPVDLSGEWQLDRSRSESPRRPDGGGGGGWQRGPRGGGGGGGGWEGRRGGMGGYGRDRNGPGVTPESGMRPGRLPERIRVVQKQGLVELEDSTGTVVQSILVGQASVDTAPVAEDVQQLSGKWKGDHLQAERSSDRGKITETLSLEDGGKTLVIQTKIEAEGPRPSRDFKRVYERASGA